MINTPPEDTLMSLAHEGLARFGGLEYANLDFSDQRRLSWDYCDAEREDGCSIPEYLRRIGTGNLKVYAQSFRVACHEGR